MSLRLQHPWHRVDETKIILVLVPQSWGIQYTRPLLYREAKVAKVLSSMAVMFTCPETPNVHCSVHAKHLNRGRARRKRCEAWHVVHKKSSTPSVRVCNNSQSRRGLFRGRISRGTDRGSWLTPAPAPTHFNPRDKGNPREHSPRAGPHRDVYTHVEAAKAKAASSCVERAGGGDMNPVARKELCIKGQ